MNAQEICLDENIRKPQKEFKILLYNRRAFKDLTAEKLSAGRKTI